MIERDYIMRLIRQFMAAIARFLDKKGQQDDDEKIKELPVGGINLVHT